MIVGFFAKLLKYLPVERPMDLAIQGKGKIVEITEN